MLRFLFNTVYYHPARGGGGPIHSVSALAEELVRRGHHVTVICSDRDIPGKLLIDTAVDHSINGVRVRYFATSPSLLQRTRVPMFNRAGTFAFGAELPCWLEENARSFDVIHSQISFTSSNPACARIAKKNKKLYFYHQRGNLDPVRLRRGFFKKWIYIQLIEKRVMSKADVLIALTQYEIKTFRRLGLQNRIEVIPNGIERTFGAFSQAPLRPDIVSLLKGLEDRLVFLFLSRIHPVKGPEIFAEAFIQAAHTCRNIEAILAGPDELGTLGRVQERITQAGLSRRFRSVGTVTGNEKIALLLRANCFVLPTLSEGMSMALLEALACGCAILTSPGAYFDAIQTSGAGIIAGRNANAFGEAMTSFSKEGIGGLRARGDRGKALVERHFSWRSIAERYENICNDVLQDK